MTKPVNIYTISRIKKEYWFSAVETHDSNKRQRHRTPRHEMGSLFNLRNEYIAHGFSKARENLAVVTVNAPKLFEKIVKILAR